MIFLQREELLLDPISCGYVNLYWLKQKFLFFIFEFYFVRRRKSSLLVLSFSNPTLLKKILIDFFLIEQMKKINGRHAFSICCYFYLKYKVKKSLNRFWNCIISIYFLKYHLHSFSFLHILIFFFIISTYYSTTEEVL